MLATDWLDDGFASQFIAGIARRLHSRLRTSCYGLDDIEQHLTIELWQQRNRFDDARGTWEAFVTKVVRTAACKLLRHQRAIKRDDRLNVSLMFEVPSTSSSSDLRLDLATAIKQLSPGQKRFLAAIGTGPRDEVRATLGISRRKFDARKQALRRTFSSLDLDEYCC